MRKAMKVKPCKSIGLAMLILWITVFLTYGIIASIRIYFSKGIEAAFPGIIFTCGCVALGLIVFCVIRLFQSSYYLIDKDGITHYTKGKIRFKISKDDIMSIGHRHLAWYKKFGMLIRAILNWDPKCDLISIRYNKADIENTSYIMGSNLYLCTLSYEEKQNGCKEYCDCLTRRQIEKICKLLELSATQGITVIDEKTDSWDSIRKK